MENRLLVTTLHGLKWSSIAHLIKQILQYITTVILVALISPSDFGLMAMAMIVIGFLEIFKDLGSSAAIIQIENPSEELKSSIFWLNLFFGVFISLFIYFSSPLIAYLYNSKDVVPILKVVAFTFAISGLSILQKAIFEKDLKFELLSKIELFASVLAFITAIVLAYYGYGVWSLVIQAIVNSALNTTLLNFFSKWKPKFIFKVSEFKLVANYSLNLLGFNLVNYFARNSDYFLIGKFLGENQLGHYYLAYRLMLYPIQNITLVISRVLFPSFALIKNDNKRFKNVYLQLTNSIAMITFPLMAGLGLVSHAFSEVFLKSNWNYLLVAKLIMVLAPVGALQSIISTIGNIYQAKGKTDWMFRWSIFYTFIIIIGFLTGLKWGVIGISISYLITNILMLFPAFIIPFKLIDLNIFYFIRSFNRTIISVILMSTIVFITSLLIENLKYPLLNLIILIVTGIFSYILISVFVNRKKILEFKEIFSQYLTSAKN